MDNKPIGILHTGEGKAPVFIPFGSGLNVPKTEEELEIYFELEELKALRKNRNFPYLKDKNEQDYQDAVKKYLSRFQSIIRPRPTENTTTIQDKR